MEANRCIDELLTQLEEERRSVRRQGDAAAYPSPLSNGSPFRSYSGLVVVVVVVVVV